MNNQDLLTLLWEKYLADQKMTAGELQQLRALVQSPKHQQQLDQLLAQLYQDEQQTTTSEANAREAFEEVWQQLQTPAPAPPVVSITHRFRWLSYAAAVLAVFAAPGGTYLLTRHKTVSPGTQQARNQPAAIQPGSEKAMLTLADGSVISLNDVQNGTLAQQGNTQVVKQANGQLSYQASGTAANTVLYNTIQTPRGGKFHLILPDGSKVWLNAASSLHYPTAFTGNNREVTLTGEAYFEIAPNTAQPFRVLVNNMQVNVLGTHFNIMAYAEEAAIQTTLLQGSVSVNTTDSRKLLLPGQRASLHRHNNTLQLQSNVDTEETIAWKNDQIQFAGTDLHAAMRMIERWYDVEVEYRGAVPNAHFRGSLASSASITEVLNQMQQTGEVHFTISGRKIIITP